MNEIKIRRNSQDICIWGKKNQGKNFVLSLWGLYKYLDGKTIYSNYHLNYPHIRINTLKDAKKIHDGVMLGDDLENWISSKFISNKEKRDILELTLNLGKRSTDIYFSTKRVLELDKTLRSGADYFVKVELFLNREPYSYSDFEELSQYLDNCCILCTVYDDLLEPFKYEIISDLEIWKDLFDTTEEVKKLKSFNDITPVNVKMLPIDKHRSNIIDKLPK